MKENLGLGPERLLPIRRGGDRAHSHGPEQIGGDRGGKEGLRLGAVVAEGTPRAGFVLDLHHQDGSQGIRGLQVAHQRRKCTRVGRKRGLRKGGGRVDGAALPVHDAPVELRLLLHPHRHVMLAAIFPGAEPQEDQMHPVGTSLGQQGVHGRCVVDALPGFKLFPIDGDLHGVGVHEFDGRPHLGENRRPAARVVDLGPEHKEGRAIDEKGVTPVLGDDTRNRGLGHLSEGRLEGEGGHERRKAK